MPQNSRVAHCLLTSDPAFSYWMRVGTNNECKPTRPESSVSRGAVRP